MYKKSNYLTMKIVLLGYGKMGRVIEGIALSRGHEIVGRIDENNRGDFQTFTPENTDVVIEFSHPSAAMANLTDCLNQGLPVVCGTTGWLENRSEIEALCATQQGAFFYASNYSIGVNLFFRLNTMLARLMNTQPDYSVKMTDIHHIHKKDAPSGTAITLAEGIITHHEKIQNWELDVPEKEGILPIHSLREGEIPGTHIIDYQSINDTISISHTAHSRDGFALGAVIAAEWLVGKKGIFGMNDLLA